MRIVIPRERAPGERRVAMTPAAIGRVASDDLAFDVESGAGEASSFSDDDYREVGAGIAESAEALCREADVVLAVAGTGVGEAGGADGAALLPTGATLISLLRPHANPELLARLAERGLTALSLELMPRTTFAQRMDALSAFSTVAGYSAVIRAAEALDKFFPMLTTAAGTMAPANVFIIGAGVAGLQAIATARRLGGVVEAFDIRPAVKEQVQSLGAKFVEWEDGGEETETESGYAAEVSEEKQEHERQLIAEHVAKSDVVITTALVPGRKAPRLLTSDMVAAMRPGSVVVDLAGEAGGNCELSRPGETVVEHGVVIQAPLDLASSLPYHASQMYARILSTLLGHLVRDGELVIDLEDEITDAICVTHEGKVRFSS